MAIFAVLSRRHMSTMIELDKIRNLRDRHPFNRFTLVDLFEQEAQFRIGIFRLRDLLMTTPAFCLRRNPGGRAARRSRMAEEALDAKSYMSLVRELDRLGRRLLRLRNSISRKAENRQDCDHHGDQTQRLHQPAQKSLDHGCS